MNKITRLLATAALLFGVLGGVSSVKAGKTSASGTKTPLLLLKNGVINSADFDITPVAPSTLTTDNLYAATFTSKAGTSNVFQYKDLDVSDYDKAVIKYSILDANEWRVNTPTNHYALPSGTDQTYEIDLSSVDTYNDFTVFSSYQNHTVGSSITISEVYLYKSSSVEPKNKGFGGEITSLSGITDGTMFVISNNGTKAKYFYTNNENENANVEDVPADAYCYFTLEKYDGDDIAGDNIYWIKITNENGDGYPRGSDGATNYYLNAVLGYTDVVISGTKTGWGGDKKDALWYVTYDAEKGFSFQNVYRAENSSKSWLAIGNNFEAEQKYLKLYKSINYLNFNNVGTATIDKKCFVAEGGLTYDSSTGVLTSDGTAGKLVLAFATPVDMRNLFQFNVTQSGQTGDILSRLEFYDEDDTKINTWNSIKLGNTWNASGIDNNATNAFLNNKPVKKMVWPSDANASNNGKTATITSVEFTCKTIACAKAGETQLKTLPWNKKDGSGTETPAWNMNVSTDTYYGNFSGDPTHYADLTGYEELRIYRDNNDGFRAFFINAAGSATNTIDGGNAASTWNAEGKYWSIDLSKIEKWDSKVALKSIKSASSGLYNIVKNIVVYKAPAANAPQYILTGSGMQLAETVAALADATATAIDATGVTGITTNSEAGRTLLTSANPNCLFLGTSGIGGLANTQNVITSGTCDNLVLTDGYAFQAPADFTATEATYTTTISAAGAATLCLPFKATIPGGVTAYTLSYTSGDKATATPVETTIPANTPVLLNGSGAQTLTGANVAIDADAANTSGALTGVFEQGYAPVNSYILQNQGGNIGFYKVATANTNVIKPFRAYLTVEGEGPSRLSIDFIENDEPTGVGAALMNNEEMNNEVYNLCGQRVEKATKGLYIKNGKKVIMK